MLFRLIACVGINVTITFNNCKLKCLPASSSGLSKPHICPTQHSADCTRCITMGWMEFQTNLFNYIEGNLNLICFFP